MALCAEVSIDIAVQAKTLTLWRNPCSMQHTNKEIIEQSQRHFKEDRFGLWLIGRKGASEAIGFVGLWYFFDEAQPQLNLCLAAYSN